MLTPALLVSLCASSASIAGVSSFNLADYTLSATIALPVPAAEEASAITYNWDTGNLFILGDEGDAILEITTAGVTVSTMTLTNFADTEGLTYIGGGQFVITEERLQDAYRFTYVAGGTISSAAMQTASLGPTVGNVGIEGISYDNLNGTFITVKEKTPQAVNTNSINFAAGTAVVNSLFAPNLGLLDLSDVQVLSTIPGLIGTTDQDNLLILSQESGRILEVSRTGTILSSLDVSAIAGDMEGLTVGPDGTIYAVSEGPFLYKFVPAPGATLLALVAGGVAVSRRRR